MTGLTGPWWKKAREIREECEKQVEISRALSEEIRAKAEGFKKPDYPGGIGMDGGRRNRLRKGRILEKRRRNFRCYPESVSGGGKTLAAMFEEAERFEKNILELQKLEKCREALRSADVDAVQKQTALEGEVKTIRERLEEIREKLRFYPKKKRRPGSARWKPVGWLWKRNLRQLRSIWKKSTAVSS